MIDDFFDNYGLVRQQLDSFNEFLDVTMQKVVNETYTLKFYPTHHKRNRDGKVSVELLLGSLSF